MSHFTYKNRNSSSNIADKWKQREGWIDIFISVIKDVNSRL